VFVCARRSQGSGVFRLALKGEKLTNVEGMFSKSDPFFELARHANAAGGQSFDNIFRSETVHNNLNPVWKEVVIDVSILCGGDPDLPLRLTVFDHESSGKHKLMGELNVTVNGLIAAANRRDALKIKRKDQDTGSIFVLKADLSVVDSVTESMTNMRVSAPAPAPVQSASKAAAYVPTPGPSPSSSSPPTRYDFVDYISGGCQLNAHIAIDFTGSNGDPRIPGTLHYLNSTAPNDYEKAISAIVSILAKYDSDQLFPVYGFGAKYDGVVRHCFQCGGAPQHKGVAGVLQAYKSVFQSGLTMSGPTVFGDVITTAAAHARQAQQAAMQRGGQCYTVLLIVTDGAVSDIQATAKCLAEASSSPLSVVIVGVGNADFSPMQFLDDNSGAQRDIAQCVEFNKCSHSSQALTSATLDEIPTQLTGYFESRNMPPGRPLKLSDSMVFVEDDEEINLSLSIGENEIVVTRGGDDFVDGFNARR
jgi:hypothetical protein